MKSNQRIRIRREWRDHIGSYVFVLEELVDDWEWFPWNRISRWQVKSYPFTTDYELVCRWANHYNIDRPPQGDS